MTDSLTFLGTGDALGVPRVYCDCPVCSEARATGANRRTRCSALVRGASGVIGLDCSPDWRAQMEAARLRSLDAVLITHAHHDHIGGLPDLADAARWLGSPTPVFAPSPVLAEITARYPWIGRHLALCPLEKELDLAGYRVTAWEVNHGRNGRSHAFRFERPGHAWAYCPDSIDLNQAERSPLRRLDLLVLGAAYYQETAPAARRSLYDMVEALELLADVQPTRALFTHLSHGVDVREAYALPPNVHLARDGMVTPLV